MVDYIWRMELLPLVHGGIIFEEMFYNIVANFDPVIRRKPGSPNYRYLSTARTLAVTL